MITIEALNGILNCGVMTASRWVNPINDAMTRYDISNRLRKASFIAQIGHESGMLKNVVENLNYSAAGLRSTFSKYFTIEQANAYARQPERIASRAYANRMGNGNEASKDGWKYRGRGLIQLTGKDNYTRFSQDRGVDFVKNPDLVADAEYAALAAGWFWHVNKINTLADQQLFDQTTQRVNGGQNGRDHRQDLFIRGLQFID